LWWEHKLHGFHGGVRVIVENKVARFYGTPCILYEAANEYRSGRKNRKGLRITELKQCNCDIFKVTILCWTRKRRTMQTPLLATFKSFNGTYLRTGVARGVRDCQGGADAPPGPENPTNFSQFAGSLLRAFCIRNASV